MSKEEEIQKLLTRGEMRAAEEKLEQIPESERNKHMFALQVLFNVFHTEMKNHLSETVFDGSVDLSVLYEHFVRLKLLVRRLEYDLPEQYQSEIYPYCKKWHVSQYLLAVILLNNVFDTVKTCRKLIEIYMREEGKSSEKTQYFVQLLNLLREEKNHG